MYCGPLSFFFAFEKFILVVKRVLGCYLGPPCDVPSGYRYFRSASSMVQRTIPVTGKATIIVATILYAGWCDEVAAVREIGVYRRVRKMAVMSAYVVRGRVMRLLVGLHLARVWLRQRIAVGSIWRQIRLLMLKMTEWRWNYRLFEWKTTNVGMFLFFFFF
ncbi:hypothetical protein DER44DRAFT_128096 [Fusarium oxysporum]|nr:hypothetical protein DER44DRAFT_128096 [Fusarium oxysporum]